MTVPKGRDFFRKEIESEGEDLPIQGETEELKHLIFTPRLIEVQLPASSLMEDELFFSINRQSGLLKVSRSYLGDRQDLIRLKNWGIVTYLADRLEALGREQVGTYLRRLIKELQKEEELILAWPFEVLEGIYERKEVSLAGELERAFREALKRTGPKMTENQRF